MAFTPGKSGNPGGKPKEKLFHQALMVELKSAGDDMPRLREVAQNLIAQACNPNSKDFIPAVRELANRLDGMPVQQQDINITEKVTVIRSPEIGASTDAWKQKLLTAQTIKSSGNPSQGHKLNS